MGAQVNIFNDSLETRAFQARFRGIGNPFHFLDDIGIIPIKEFIFRGATLIDLAEEINLPVTTIKRWIDENGFQADIEEAAVVSAEGYIARGEKLLKEATNDFALKKAKAIIEHGRFMASKKDKKGYGNTVQLGEGPANVTYQFIVGEGQANTQINYNTSPADTPYNLPHEPATSTEPQPSAKSTAPKPEPIPLEEAVEKLPEITLELSPMEETLQGLGKQPAYLKDSDAPTVMDAESSDGE